MGYVVHSLFRVAICTACGMAVCADDLQTHANRVHNLPVLSDLRCMELVKEHGLLNGEQVERPAPFQAPCNFLLRPVSAHYCKICHDNPLRETYTVANKSSMNKHLASDHPSYKGLAQEFFVKCHAQFLFAFNAYKKYFAVDMTKSNRPPEMNPADKFRERLAALRPPPSERVVKMPEDDRVLTRFLQETKWAEAVHGLKADEMVSIVRVPLPTEDFHNVCRAVAGYFNFVAEDVTTTFSVFNLRTIIAKDE